MKWTLLCDATRINLPRIGTAIAVAVALTAIVCAAELTPQQEEQAGRLLASLRGAKTTIARRVALIKQLAAISPAAAERAEQVLKADLDRIAARADELKAVSPLDAEIARLRKVLADVRNNPSEQKLESIGDPAAEQLKKLFAARWAQMQPIEAQRTVLRQQLAAWKQFCELLKAEAGEQAQDRPFGIGLREITTRLDEVAASIAPAADEQKARDVLAANAELMQKLDSKESAGVQILNEMRIVFGLQPLLVDLKLCAAARGHSADMATHGFFSHESPVPRKKTFSDRAQLAGTTASSENIYVGSASAASAINAWFHSPGHHQNMLGNHKRLGLGRSGDHWTQMFGD